MRGNQDVLAQLNIALKAELTAIIQYMVQAEMCENWGYARLGGEIKKQAIEEMGHAEGLIERILFLDGTPVVDLTLTPKISSNVTAQLEDDLKDETDAVKEYNDAIKVCQEVGDNGTRELFERMLKDEERHADHFESRLHAIRELGIESWLTEQLKGDK
ncbi:MAG: bacterioferritin [Terriglobia bacterium]|jgi:bacterioferritin